jgi:hypothetical protein
VSLTSVRWHKYGAGAVLGELLPWHTESILDDDDAEILFRREGAVEGMPGEWRWKNPTLAWAGKDYILLIQVR